MAKIVIKKPLRTQLKVVTTGARKVAPKAKAIPVPTVAAASAPVPTPVFVPVPVPAQPAPKPAQAAAQPAQAAAEKDSASRAKLAMEYMVSVVDNDVRSELGRLADAAELLGKGIGDASERERQSAFVRQSVKDVLRLLDDIVSISAAGKSGEASEESVRLGEIVESSIAPFRKEIDAKGINFSIDAHNLPTVRVNAHFVRQLVRNFMANAVKLTETGRIGLVVTHFNDKLKIVVEDTGCGLTVQQQVAFADSIAPTDDMREFSGIFFMKELVLAMGGEISLKSTPGIGTVVTIVLSGVKAVNGGGNASSMQRLDSSVFRAPLPRAARLLVVDDSPISRAVTTSMLNVLGFSNVAMVASGSEALVKILAGTVDAVITDLMMPEMDGRMLVREIRGLPTYVNMPVYALTADDSIREECKSAGFTGIILKPVTKEKLHIALG